MKPKDKLTSNIIIGSFCIFVALMAAGIGVGLLVGVKDVEPERMAFAIVFLSIFSILFLFFGIRSIVRGVKTYRMFTRGRIREAKVLSVAPLKGTSLQGQLIISFYGESGNENQLILTTLWTHLKKLEVGQYIECYVNGETGYVDVNNIKVVREKQEEIDFE